MQSKSSRGVQQEDVWGAADSLIAEGLRPTIERVRLKMGRGSPNTVGPSLVAWFATLGTRLKLGVAKTDEVGAPVAVLQAMDKLWEIAVTAAHEQAHVALDQIRGTLESDRSALAQREADLAHQAAVINERLLASETTLEDAKKQIADLNTRLDGAHAMLDKRSKATEQYEAKLLTMQHQLAESRKQLDQAVTLHAEERQRLESRAIANERRLMEELDRERQESKRAKVAKERAERRAEELQVQLQSDQKEYARISQEKDNEFQSARHAHAASETRATELRGLLDEQRAFTSTQLDQINRAIAEAAQGNRPQKRKREGAGKGFTTGKNPA